MSAQFLASTARKTAASLTAARAVVSGAAALAPSSTSIAAYALPLMRGIAAADVMRPSRAGGAREVAWLAASGPEAS